ncbi:unnamed protein product [Durusdinium trenchii]|uniref:Uncharacterized protein n=1 Tax=Durusdinium trenchii TaxID=1381693 RepID=A0ABP0PUT6_9DINO
MICLICGPAAQGWHRRGSGFCDAPQNQCSRPRELESQNELFLQILFGMALRGPSDCSCAMFNALCRWRASILRDGGGQDGMLWPVTTVYSFRDLPVLARRLARPGGMQIHNRFRSRLNQADFPITCTPA